MSNDIELILLEAYERGVEDERNRWRKAITETQTWLDCGCDSCGYGSDNSIVFVKDLVSEAISASKTK